MDPITLLLGLATTLIFYLWYRQDDPRLPPIPATPLPIVGHMPFIGRNPRSKFKEWRKKYGDIFTVYMGQSRVIVVNGYDLMKEIFVKKGGFSNERPPLFVDEACGKFGKGLINSSGNTWREHREVTISILRSLGMGKNIMAERIQEIAEDLVVTLRSLKGKPTELTPITSITVANVICSLTIGHRFKHDDKSFRRVIDEMRGLISEGGPTNLVNYLWFLRYVPGDLFKGKSLKLRASYIMDEFVHKFVDQMDNDDTLKQDPDNFIAAYINERNKRLKDDKTTCLDNDNLCKVIYEMFGAGMDTTTNTINWAVLYMIHKPDMQEKLFQEIEREIGTERLPNMNDKVSLPYVNAFIQETQRVGSVVPLSVPHASSKEFAIGDYVIPGGTQLLVNLDSVLFDKKIWGEDAESFRPERFLDENGKVMTPEHLIPFSLGRRICAGEALAKMELFLVLTTLIQHFKFLPENPKSLPSLETDFGFTANPFPYKVRVVDRMTSD